MENFSKLSAKVQIIFKKTNLETILSKCVVDNGGGGIRTFGIPPNTIVFKVIITAYQI